MAWLTEQELRDAFNISDIFSVESQQLAFANETALDLLKDWITDADFQLAVAENSADLSVLITQKRIRKALGFLTISILTLTATQIRQNGVVRSISNNISGDVEAFLSPDQLAAIREQFFDNFKQLIKPYAIIPLYEISLTPGVSNNDDEVMVHSGTSKIVVSW